MATGFLHIGTMKSGSTFLENTCIENRQALTQAGIRFFGPETRTAVLDLKRARKLPQANVGDWSRFAARVRSTPSDVLIVNELLFPIPMETVNEVATALSSHELHVVATLRDISKVAPSHWQERIAAGSRVGWTEFCRRVSQDSKEESPSRGFWAAYDIVPVLSKWLQLLPPERFTVVVVPPSRSDPRLLWELFLDAIEVPSSGTTLAAYYNPSMGATSAELLREVTAQVTDLSGADRRRVFRNVLAKRVLTQRRSKEPRFAITPSLQSLFKTRTLEMIESIQAAGVRVMGNLDDLIPADEPLPGIQPDDISDSDMLEAAVFALAEMGRQMVRDRAQISALKEAGTPEG